MKRIRTRLLALLLYALEPRRLGRFFLHPRVRAVLAWVAVSLAAADGFYYAWTGYDNSSDPEGNLGHIYIDFSGQWLMGRMLARGEGDHLYNKACLRQALNDAYLPEDAGKIDSWLIESADRPGVGGPLYPPINALLFYPLGLLRPGPAYRLTQIGNFSLTFIIGFLAWMLTRGRVWAAVAAGVVLAFPGWDGAACLGQNALLSLALLTIGWLLISRNRPWLGGLVWGLLAFKPVWAAAFFLVPLLMRRWRVCAAMLLTGLALALLTLPFVGWQTWLDWLAVGKAATIQYTKDENWINLSRDLQGLPRRWLLEFDGGLAIHPEEHPLPTQLGLALWLTALALTVFVALWRWRRPAGVEGPPVAFLMTGAWLGCFHFMYYDTLLAALPLCLLFTEPRRYLQGPGWTTIPWTLGPTWTGVFGSPHWDRVRDWRTVPEGFRMGSGDSVQTGATEDSSAVPTQDDSPAPVPVTPLRFSVRGLWLWNPFPPTVLALLLLLPHLVYWLNCYGLSCRYLTYPSPPYDTFCILALWMWCGWRWLRAGSAGPISPPSR